MGARGSKSALGFGLRLGTSAVLATTLGCITSCFVRGTRIRTPTGTRPIEELAIGDEVVSFVESTMALVVRRVVAVHVARVDRVRTLTIRGRMLVTTAEHPFWDAERRRWTRAGDLVRGDVLALHVEGRLAPAVLEALADEDRDAEVFNLTVEGPEHTYLAEDVAVHNKDTPCENCGPVTPAPAPSSTLPVDAGPPAPRDFEVRVTPLGDKAGIDDAVLRRMEPPLPDTLFPPTDQVAPIVARTGTSFSFPTQTLAIIGGNPDPQSRPAAVLEIRGLAPGSRFLLVGATSLTIGSKGEPLPEGPNVGFVSIKPLSPACAELSSKLDVPALAATDFGKRFVLAQPAASGDCITVNATPETAGAGIAFKVTICGGVPAWPFAASDLVTLERPKMLEDAPTGIRLVRTTDNKALELARIARQNISFDQAGVRYLVLPTDKCTVQPSPPSCGSLILGGKIEDQGSRRAVFPEQPQVLKDGTGSVFLLQATRVLFSASCAPDVGTSIELAAVSKP